MKRFIAIDLAKPKGQRLIVDIKYIISIEPTDVAWEKSTGVACYINVMNHRDRIPCAESATTILTRIQAKEKL